MRMNEFEAYKHYLALKLHFSSDYDYFKYNGKTNATQQSFEKRKDRFRFSRLARKLDDPLLIEFFVSNLILGNVWVGEMDEKVWKEWVAKNESIEYIFKNEAEKLLTQAPNFDIIFNCNNGNHPKLVKAYLGKKINLETLVIFEKLVHYRKTFDKEIREQIIWPKVSRLIEKYEPFVDVNIWRCKKELIEIVETEGLI